MSATGLVLRELSPTVNKPCAFCGAPALWRTNIYYVVEAPEPHDPQQMARMTRPANLCPDCYESGKLA